MGKKKQTPGLGRALIKERFGNSKNRKFVGDKSMLHTTEIQDGYDWGRLNLQSVTEESSFQEFLSTAELTGTEFQAEKLNIKFVNPRNNIGLLSKDEKLKVDSIREAHKDLIKIPRRPQWDKTTTPEALQLAEKENFLEWRRNLSVLQENEQVLLTPYEKNLEFWRQLWRVVERSDVIVQIVDARNPLLFRCEDLEKYVKEVGEHKKNVILINKADLLTEAQRQYWADYFAQQNARVLFFSATQAVEEDKLDSLLENSDEEEYNSTSSNSTDDEDESGLPTLKESVESLKVSVENISAALDSVLEKVSKLPKSDDSIVIDVVNIESPSLNNSTLLSRDELIACFRNLYTKTDGPTVMPDVSTIGLVGYPNVGKSSTINALMMAKKVSVSATPGKTKHFQTLYLDKDLLLCDCPGLVMPTFVYTKAEMILNGILPVDQMRDHVPPVNLLCRLIPRHVLEDKYGIMLPKPMDGEDPGRPPTTEELLNCYGYNRGFMTANGQPDNPRSARYILKDFINGKLLFAHAPPNSDQMAYHSWEEKTRIVSQNHVIPPRELRAAKPSRLTSEDLDQNFFVSGPAGAHAKGRSSSSATWVGKLGNDTDAPAVPEGKPWKKLNKHENKKKKEKLRRVYSHLDQH